MKLPKQCAPILFSFPGQTPVKLADITAAVNEREAHLTAPDIVRELLIGFRLPDFVSETDRHIPIEIITWKRSVPASTKRMHIAAAEQEWKTQSGKARVPPPVKREIAEQVVSDLMAAALPVAGETLAIYDTLTGDIITTDSNAARRAVVLEALGIAIYREKVDAIERGSLAILADGIDFKGSPGQALLTWLATVDSTTGFLVAEGDDGPTKIQIADAMAVTIADESGKLVGAGNAADEVTGMISATRQIKSVRVEVLSGDPDTDSPCRWEMAVNADGVFTKVKLAKEFEADEEGEGDGGDLFNAVASIVEAINVQRRVVSAFMSLGNHWHAPNPEPYGAAGPVSVGEDRGFPDAEPKPDSGVGADGFDKPPGV